MTAADMLHDFLNSNRSLLIERCRNMVGARSVPKLPFPELTHGIPIFIDQIIKTLVIELHSDVAHRNIMLAEADPGSEADVDPMATLHGRDLLEEGFTIEQVIRDYGDVCQAVTNLAVETATSISADEFRIFNRCLDDAIAAAVTEYSQQNSQITLVHTQAQLSAAKRDVREAQRRALHDSLTGLPNRELFGDRLAHAIALADRHAWTLAVMFIDLDQFKTINDAHGHLTGDIILKTIAERLLQCVRDEDTVYRNGGDEFLYLVMDPRGNQNIGRIADFLFRTIAKPVFVADLEFVIKPSIGIAIYPDHGSVGDELIKNADTAMYHAKKRSRGVVFFDRQKAGLTAINAL
jgi:diguanylate cyclase (GGDEF)-like protein